MRRGFISRRFTLACEVLKQQSRRMGDNQRQLPERQSHRTSHGWRQLLNGRDGPCRLARPSGSNSGIQSVNMKPSSPPNAVASSSNLAVSNWVLS